MHQPRIASTQPASDYELEVPTHIKYVLMASLGSGVVGLILTFVARGNQPLFAAVLVAVGIIGLIPTTILGLVTNNRMRRAARQRMMQTVAWRGDEMVLDVGCGNGYLLLEAAKHLTTGKAIGIDVWKDNSGHQSAEAAWRNAQIEGVINRIDLQNVDACALPFEGETFDVIVSSLALHHMGGDSARKKVLQEMIRVLKPGGIILLYDMFPIIGQAAAVLRRQRVSQVKKISGLAMVVLSANK